MPPFVPKTSGVNNNNNNNNNNNHHHHNLNNNNNNNNHNLNPIMKWKNIPDVVLSVHTSIPQLVPTKVYRVKNQKEQGLDLRTFALIVCAQRCWAGNATVIRHASLHVLVTIDMASKTPGKKSHRFYSFASLVAPIFLIMNHLLYLLSTKYDKMKKISPREVIFF